MRHLAVSETFSEEGFSIERSKWVASLLKNNNNNNKTLRNAWSNRMGLTTWGEVFKSSNPDSVDLLSLEYLSSYLYCQLWPEGGHGPLHRGSTRRT